MEKVIRSKPLFRSYELDRALINTETRTVELSFSSEEPYERWFGTEILDHGKKSVRMERLNNGAPLLVNHDTNQQVGVLESAWIGKDKKGRASVRFSKSATADEVFQDVTDGIRKNVSVGYMIHKMVLEEESDDQAVYRATDWEPLEVSIVAIPADASVGVGRAMKDEEKEIIVIKKEKTMTEEELAAQRDQARQQAKQEELDRVREIRALGKEFKMDEMASKSIDDNTPVADFRKKVLAAMPKPDGKIEVGEDRAMNEPFKNLGEYFYAVAFTPQDKRLINLSRMGTRAMSMGVGAAGGFAIPEQFLSTLMAIDPSAAVVRPRATIIPAGSPPDAALTIPALDQGTGHDIYAGVAVAWLAEGMAKAETQAFLRQVQLEPKEVAGILYATDKLLRNWDAASALIERQFRLAVIGAEDTAFLQGNGVGKPLGITKLGAKINVTRATASQINWADIYGMYELMKFGGRPQWYVHQTAISWLIRMKNDASNLVWQSSARDAAPQSILGYPVNIIERGPSIGSEGDLMFLDLSYYLIKDGSGPFVETSTAPRFSQNQTAFKITWNVDGQSWLNDVIPLENNAANKISPFVVLK